jgi:hypothetical protein
MLELQARQRAVGLLGSQERQPGIAPEQLIQALLELKGVAAGQEAWQVVPERRRGGEQERQAEGLLQVRQLPTQARQVQLLVSP